MQLLWLVVLIGAAVTQGEGTGSHAKSCTPPFGKHPFHADRFQGIWYATAKHVTLPGITKDLQLSCAKINYTVTRTANATILGVVAEIKQKSGETRRIELKAKELWSWGGIDSAASQAVRRSNETPWGEVGQHIVLNTDYDTYAIVQICDMLYDERDNEIKRFQLTEILSREPTMDANKLKLLKSVASSFDADETEFQDIVNSECQ